MPSLDCHASARRNLASDSRESLHGTHQGGCLARHPRYSQSPAQPATRDARVPRQARPRADARQQTSARSTTAARIVESARGVPNQRAHRRVCSRDANAWVCDVMCQRINRATRIFCFLFHSRRFDLTSTPENWFNTAHGDEAITSARQDVRSQNVAIISLPAACRCEPSATSTVR